MKVSVWPATQTEDGVLGLSTMSEPYSKTQMEPDTDDLNCAFPVPTHVSVYRFYMHICAVIVMSQMFIVLSRFQTIAVQCKHISTDLLETVL